MDDKVRPEDVNRWIELLRSSVSTDRLKGATELASFAVRTRHRGAVRTRGSITRAAPSRLPRGVTLSGILDVFQDQHVEVRRAVVFALGELSDGTVVRVLRQITETDRDPAVREDAIDALGKIGGEEAVGGMTATARADPNDNVRIRSIRALTDLAGAEPAASHEVVGTLAALRDEISSEAVKAQIAESLSRLERTEGRA